MPAEGVYRLRELPMQEWAAGVAAAISQGAKSSIGYPQNVEIIRQLTGHSVSLSREETILSDGDEMYIMALRYRMDGDKGRQVALEDFKFLHATFSA